MAVFHAFRAYFPLFVGILRLFVGQCRGNTGAGRGDMGAKVALLIDQQKVLFSNAGILFED